MNTFVLIDLASQLDEVLAAVEGQDPAQILAWLRQFGEVQPVPHPLDPHVYGFVSRVGLRTGFRITDQGHIVIIGQHTTHARGAHTVERPET